MTSLALCNTVTHGNLVQHFTNQYAIARYMPSPVRPSVCPSITWVDQSKTVEDRIMQLSPQSSPVTLVSSWLTSLGNSKGNIEALNERGGKNRQFSANKAWYLRNGARQDHSYY